jgi:starvation-inducible outer membrane lipoprotein
MKRLIAMVAFCAALAACAHAPPPIPPGSVSTPADLTKHCPPIQHINSPANMGDSVTYITNLQKQYNVCAARNDSLDEVTSTPQQPSTSSGK